MSGEGFCDDMAEKEQISWCQALVSSAFCSQLNFREKSNRK